MRRILILSLAILGFASAEAVAVEYTILRYKKTGFCEVVLDVPRWGDHFEPMGFYNSRFEAERALSQLRKKNGCPATKSSRRLENAEKTKKPSVTHRTEPDQAQGVFFFR